MARIVIERFDGGMAEDRYEYSTGRFSVAKGFDILSFPRRLTPTRGTAADSGGTGLGNVQTFSDGIIYGVGANGSSTQLYKKPDNATGWSALSSCISGSSALNFDLLLEYPDIGSVRTTLFAGNAGICMADKSNGVSIATHALTYNSITQGIIHPKDDIAYIPYSTTTGTFIATVNTAGSWNDTALSIPGTAYVITAVTFYGNYLAIALAPRGAYTLANTGKTVATSANAGAFKSIVVLWDRDTSLATVSEVIDWGTGILQVLNNLNGRLIGVSNVGGASANITDRNSIVFKEYAGGMPQIINEISTERQTATYPTCNINPLVNFIYRDRLYFSIDIVGGSTSPTYYGLWSLGRSRDSGRYALTIERGATTDNTETSVKAACATGDYFSMVYTANGTVGFSINNSSQTTPFQATSYYESCVNPGMLLLRNTRHDFALRKQLNAVAVSFLPLIASQTVTIKYRIDSIATSGTLGAGWTTVRTYTSSNTGKNVDSTTYFETTRDASGASFSAGSNFEFRIESTGGATVTEFSYKYSKPQTIMKDE